MHLVLCHNVAELWGFTDVIGLVWLAGLLPEWQDAPKNVPGTGQDCTGWPRDDPPLRVSIIG